MEIDLSQEILTEKEEKVLNRPFLLSGANDKKFGVYVRGEENKIILVKFGDASVEVKRDDPGERKNFIAKHDGDNPGAKWEPRYWSLKMWEKRKSVNDYLSGSADWDDWDDWDGQYVVEQKDLLKILPSLSRAEECDCDECGCGKKKKKSEAAIEVVFSGRIINALKNKKLDHNDSYSKKVSLFQLKQVFRRGAIAYSHPTISQRITRGTWAMARVNMFLKMISGKRVKRSYVKADRDIAQSNLLLTYDSTIEEEIHFTIEDLIAANLDVGNYGIEHDELYNFLDDPCFCEDEYSSAAQKYFGGKKRADLDDGDFLFPENRSFPIVTPQDVPDAISNFGRKAGKMSYNAFLRRLVKFLRKKGAKFTSALPVTTKKRIKELSASTNPMDHIYETKREAMEKAREMGLSGYHKHKMQDGHVMYMPGRTHEIFVRKHIELSKSYHHKKRK